MENGVCFEASLHHAEYWCLVRIALPGWIGSWISLHCLLVAQAEVHQALALNGRLVVHERITLK
jgi:hypothetical protein